MKVSFIVLAIALTACGKETKVIEQAGAPSESKTEESQPEEYNDSDLRAELEAMKKKIGELETIANEAGKPETLEERWKREDEEITFYNSSTGMNQIYKQTTYRNENNDPIRVNYNYMKSTISSYIYTSTTEKQWSYKHSIWLLIKSSDSNGAYNFTTTFDEAEKSYEAFKAKQGA